tara:strand:+ start:2289 stop:2825 length:537 start_codon:yes stop_codon:yes gene_type:complete
MSKRKSQWPSQFSPVKPWESFLVYFDKGAKAPPIPPRMVRIKGSIDVRHTLNLKKNYQQNNVIIDIQVDNITPDGRHTPVDMWLNVSGYNIEPDPDGKYIDIDAWVLKNKGISDDFGNILDRQGKLVATKKQQNKWSGVPTHTPKPPQKQTDSSGNIMEGLTKEKLHKLIEQVMRDLK